MELPQGKHAWMVKIGETGQFVIPKEARDLFGFQPGQTILVLADETANPTYVAADLLSQAEHDELASAILVTTSRELAEKVQSSYIRGLDAGYASAYELCAEWLHEILEN